jgi:uncharacterized protein (DUF1330 family)
MTAYLLADIEVTDQEAYERYKKGVVASIAAFGGRYIARGGSTEVLEGTWRPRRLVIVEFQSMQRLKEWWYSPGSSRPDTRALMYPSISGDLLFRGTPSPTQGLIFRAGLRISDSQRLAADGVNRVCFIFFASFLIMRSNAVFVLIISKRRKNVYSPPRDNGRPAALLDFDEWSNTTYREVWER